jgi:hypothetical protein
MGNSQFAKANPHHGLTRISPISSVRESVKSVFIRGMHFDLHVAIWPIARG